MKRHLVPFLIIVLVAVLGVLTFHPDSRDKFLSADSLLAQLGKLLTGSSVPEVYFDEGFEYFNTYTDLYKVQQDGSKIFDTAGISSTANRIYLVSSRTHSGNRAVRFYAVSGEGSESYLGKKTFSFDKGDDVWMSGWYYLERVKTNDNSNIFLMDLEEVGNDQGPGLRLFLSGPEGYLQVEEKFGDKIKHRQTNATFPVNRWVNVITHFKLTESGDGLIEVWQDGARIIQTQGRTLPTTGTIYNSVQFGITANANSRTRSLYMDDVVVSSSPLQTNAVGDASLSATPPAAIPRNAFLGQYFDDSNFSNQKLVRTDSAINFNWGYGSPASNIGDNSFSVRWWGDFDFAEGGTYRFTTKVDDGIRVWIDGIRIIDKWFSQSATTYEAEIPVTAGNHRIQVDYFENRNPAEVSLSWGPTGSSGDPAIPDSGEPDPGDTTGGTTEVPPSSGGETTELPPISYDHTSSGSGIDVTSLSYSHTVGSGQNKMLVVGIQSEDSNESDCKAGAVSYAGHQMTKIAEAVSGSTTRTCSSLWYLANPPVGANAVEITMSSAGQVSFITSGATSLFNIAQRPPDVSATAFGTSISTISKSISVSTANSWIIDSVAQADTTDFISLSGQIERYDVSNTSERGAGSTVASVPSGSISLGWSTLSPTRLSYVVAAFAPATSAQTFPDLAPIDPVVSPTLDFRISAYSVDSGSTVVISWDSTNASTCTGAGSGSWPGPKSADGAESHIITADSSFTLTCYGENNTSVTDTKTVSINPVGGTTGTNQPGVGTWGDFDSDSCITNKRDSSCGSWSSQVDSPVHPSGDNYCDGGSYNCVQVRNNTPLNSGYSIYAYSQATNGNDKALWNRDLPTSARAGDTVEIQLDAHFKSLGTYKNGDISDFITIFDIENGVDPSPGPRIAIEGGELELERQKATGCSGCDILAGIKLTTNKTYRIKTTMRLSTGSDGWVRFEVFEKDTSGNFILVRDSGQKGGANIGNYTLDRIQAGNTVNGGNNPERDVPLEAYYDNFILKINNNLVN